MGSERERGRQAGRLDAEEIDQAGHAVVARAGNQEVACRPRRARGLGADAGVGGLQRAVGSSGQ
jgi:hypothetical protein